MKLRKETHDILSPTTLVKEFLLHFMKDDLFKRLIPYYVGEFRSYELINVTLPNNIIELAGTLENYSKKYLKEASDLMTKEFDSMKSFKIGTHDYLTFYPLKVPIGRKGARVTCGDFCARILEDSSQNCFVLSICFSWGRPFEPILTRELVDTI